MFKKGLEKEAKKLWTKYGKDNLVLLNTIGYAEWQKESKNIKEEIVLNTIKLAHRQMTWFKKEKVKWIKNEKEAERLVKKFLS